MTTATRRAHDTALAHTALARAQITNPTAASIKEAMSEAERAGVDTSNLQLNKGTLAERTARLAARIESHLPSAAEVAAGERVQAVMEARRAAEVDLLTRARAAADALCPGRVHPCYDGSFSVMFGAGTHASGLAGPGQVELRVEAEQYRLSRLLEAAELPAPALKFSPRAYSLGSDADLVTAETQGAALLEAARLGRALLALTSAAK